MKWWNQHREVQTKQVSWFQRCMMQSEKKRTSKTTISKFRLNSSSCDRKQDREYNPISAFSVAPHNQEIERREQVIVLFWGGGSLVIQIYFEKIFPLWFYCIFVTANFLFVDLQSGLVRAEGVLYSPNSKRGSSLTWSFKTMPLDWKRYRSELLRMMQILEESTMWAFPPLTVSCSAILCAWGNPRSLWFPNHRIGQYILNL